MKNILFTTFLFFVLTPISAFAAVSYERIPSGTNIYTSPTISITADSMDDLCDPDLDGSTLLAWYITMTSSDTERISSYYPTTTLSVQYNPVLPVGNNYSVSVSSCNYEPPAGDIGVGRWYSEDIFNIISSGVLFGGEGSIYTATTTTGLLAAVGLVSTDMFNGIFPYLMLSAGVFVSFYIVQQIIMLLGGLKKERAEKWTGEGVMEHEFHEWKKKAKSRKKRDLDIEK